MRVAVLGAGVAGIATAYYLREAGHEVTVVDRQPAPALETSYANAGHVCPSYATPWAAPGMRWKSAKWSMQAWLGIETALKFTPRLDARQWNWLKRFLGECDARRYAINKARMGRIARYSHAQLKALRERLAIDYEQTTVGNLQVFRDQAGVDNAQLGAKVLAQAGVPHRLMSPDDCIVFDPALASARGLIAGGLLMPADETGNCQLFTSKLAQSLGENGVAFRYSTTISGLQSAGDSMSVALADGSLAADAYVLSCAHASVALARPLGLDVPIYPVKGYAVTVPIIDDAKAPKSGIVDEALKVAVTRMGNKIRAAGTAEIGARDVSVSPADCATIVKSLSELFGAIDLRGAEYWAGMRPMTPDGAPLVGATRYRNLFLATGGGSNGWTTACGIGRVTADVVSGKSPEIDISDLGLSRFG
ncbi:MAG: amino acid dehydrogenase [Betaproteobacteria bacterium]|nr:amino acid dehydrogenase [Betaproteobacteria bacterium]